jgi:hypothetical protein
MAGAKHSPPKHGHPALIRARHASFRLNFLAAGHARDAIAPFEIPTAEPGIYTDLKSP